MKVQKWDKKIYRQRDGVTQTQENKYGESERETVVERQNENLGTAEVSLQHI